MDGILVIRKEKGYTSHDVVAKLRGILHMKKIGHTGTLDPAAEGVLPVALGRGTRLVELLTEKEKTYEAVLRLGVSTDTQDMTGTVLSEMPVTVTEEEVREVVESFVGEQMQVPPMYSALKVNGKKLYELAREGKTIERKPRPVVFYEIRIMDISLPLVRISVTCSKGTYIRTLCNDIGEKLGCGGAMEELLRTRSGNFTLEESLMLSQVEEAVSDGTIMEKIVPYLIIGAVALVILIILIKNICIVQQSRAYVIERLGAFSQVWEVGIHFKLPFVERIARRVSLKEQVLDYPPQPVITKDNVTMQIDTVVYYQITDPKLYTYGVERPMMAMETLTATTLRNIIGDLELDQTLTSRDVINTKMRAILDEATDPWGIKVTRVELKNILPPQDIQNSMEKQMKAERDRRQAILQAEGTKRSQILVAEGEKEAAILKADAEKQAAILKAEAEKQAAILKADGEAQAIMAVQKAMADSLALLNEKAPNDQVIKLKALEAMQKIADGKATKIIIPSELQGFAGLASGIAESVKETK